MKKIVAFLIIGAILYACKQKGSNIVVKGNLKNPVSSYIYLQELTLENNGTKDSVLIDKSGSFKFKRQIKFPSFFTIRVGKGKPVTIIAMPKERIKITGNADDLFKTYTVEGSDESERVKIITHMLDRLFSKYDSLNRAFQQYKGNPNIVNIEKTLTMNYQNFIEEHRQFTMAFIDKWPSSLASVYALYQKIESNTFVLYKDEDFKYFVKVDSALFRTYSEVPFVKALHANIATIKEQQRVKKLNDMLSDLGSKAPDIALPSPKGDTIRLSSIKNKVVLLDFWASWCKPCREENPKLVEVYKKYKSKGFEIFQVSLDKTKESWIGAIKSDGLQKWIHVSDLKFWQSSVVAQYHFESIPTSFLIDKDGVIIAKNLRGEALENKLSDIFESTENK